MVFQIVSLVGAVLILFAFAAQQLRRLDAATMTYQSLNFAGGACLWIAAAPHASTDSSCWKERGRS